jgi:drug/metabolite transporter (DMT)-like permease
MHEVIHESPAVHRPAATRRREVRHGDWMVLLSAVFFSTMPIFGSLAYAAGMEVVPLLAWRFLLAVALLLGVSLLTGRLKPLRPGQAAGFLGMGACYLIMSFVYFHALKLSPISILTLLFYTYPAIVTLLAAVFLRETISRRKGTALALALGGCLLVLRPSELGDWRGAALALSASAMYSGFLLVGTRLTRETDPILATTWILSISALAYVGAALYQGAMAPPRTLAAWGPILGIAVVATAFSDVSFFSGLSLTGASRAAILSTLEPVCTLALSALFLQEAIPPVRFLGGALILVSVLLIHWD